jgi:hypothetical protein
MEKNTFAIEGPLGDGVLRTFFGLYGKTLLKCFIPILSCSTSKGKE